jgi:hypothetical protein
VLVGVGDRLVGVLVPMPRLSCYWFGVLMLVVDRGYANDRVSRPGDGDGGRVARSGEATPVAIKIPARSIGQVHLVAEHHILTGQLRTYTEDGVAALRSYALYYLHATPRSTNRTPPDPVP